MGRLRRLSDFLVTSQGILGKTEVEASNPLVFTVETTNFLEKIQEYTSDFLGYIHKVDEKLNEEVFILQPSTNSTYIEHDPGCRQKVNIEEERW